jgi:hypothetical protein
MKEDQSRFLSLLGQLPLRLTAEQAGWVLNCQAHDIPALISARLLKPLGNPAQNSTKFFATSDPQLPRYSPSSPPILQPTILISSGSFLTPVSRALSLPGKQTSPLRCPRK